jgi:hypothetical protein
VLNKFLLHIALVLIAFSSVAQHRRPHGKFLKDSVCIGQPVKYSLSFYHNRKAELFFPDSAWSFAPFEYMSKEYFPTHTSDSMSLDSAVYTLRTFEVKNNLELALPVFIIEQGDTIHQFSSHDKIAIKQYIDSVPDTLVFKNDAAYKNVPVKFNYPYYLSFSLLIIVTFVASYFIFGKAIFRNYRLYKMYSNHVLFLRTFDKLQKEMEDSPNLTAMEKVLGEWKNYLTKLEHKPINTFTTTEIISLFNKEELKENLQEVDRSIYSGSITGDPSKALSVLKKFSNKRYKKRRKELKNAG